MSPEICNSFALCTSRWWKVASVSSPKGVKLRYWPHASLVASRALPFEYEFTARRASIVRRQTLNFELTAEPRVDSGDSSSVWKFDASALSWSKVRN